MSLLEPENVDVFSERDPLYLGWVRIFVSPERHSGFTVTSLKVLDLCYCFLESLSYIPLPIDAIE